MLKKGTEDKIKNNEDVKSYTVRNEYGCILFCCLLLLYSLVMS